MRCYDTCCRDDDHDMSPAVVLTTFRASRIERTCGTCGGAIRPGEQYARHFLPPDTGHDTSATIAEHVSAGICYTIMNQDDDQETR